MSASELLGILLIAMAIADVVVGLMFVAPRAAESARPILKAAFLGGSALMVALGVAFLTGVLAI